MTNDPANPVTPPRVKETSQYIGRFKFKDSPTRRAYALGNRSNPYFVVKQVLLKKIPRSNNEIEVVFVMPDPEEVEIVWKPKSIADQVEVRKDGDGVVDSP